MNSGFAFIFDMDGVIVDSNPFHKISLLQFVRKYGYDFSEQQLKERIYGRTNMDWLTNLFGVMPRERLLELEEEKESLFRELMKNDMRPLPGLISFLELLDAHKIQRAIATSAPPSNVDFTLDKTGTRNFFATILDETYITHGKPNPEIYTKTVAALHQMPSQCIVFEDSLSGIAAGLAAGCKVVGVTTTHTAEELMDADHVINNFIDLDPIKLAAQVFGN